MPISRYYRHVFTQYAMQDFQLPFIALVDVTNIVLTTSRGLGIKNISGCLKTLTTVFIVVKNIYQQLHERFVACKLHTG